jgi:hypothetical protein
METTDIIVAASDLSGSVTEKGTIAVNATEHIVVPGIGRV